MFAIYSKDNCQYCTKAKKMLEIRKLPYAEYKLGPDFTTEQFVESIVPQNGKKTFPQIFFDSRYIGGADDLEIYLMDKDFN